MFKKKKAFGKLNIIHHGHMDIIILYCSAILYHLNACAPILFQFLKEASAAYESNLRSNTPTLQQQTTESSLQQSQQQSQQVRLRKTSSTGFRSNS